MMLQHWLALHCLKVPNKTIHYENERIIWNENPQHVTVRNHLNFTLRLVGSRCFTNWELVTIPLIHFLVYMVRKIPYNSFQKDKKQKGYESCDKNTIWQSISMIKNGKAAEPSRLELEMVKTSRWSRTWHDNRSDKPDHSRGLFH